MITCMFVVLSACAFSSWVLFIVGQETFFPEPISEREVTVQANAGWQNTYVTVQAGQRVQVRYESGEWTYWHDEHPPYDGSGPANWTYICAEIMPRANCIEPVPDFQSGALVARIDDQLLGIGNHHTFTAAYDGQLRLRINDGDNGLQDNAGAITVRVRVFAQ